MPTFSNKQLDDHLSKDPRTGIYQAEFKDRNGKPRSRTLKTKDRAEARQKLADSHIIEIEQAAMAKALTAEGLSAIMAGRKVTVADGIAEFEAWRLYNAAPNTVRTQIVVLRRFMADLGAQKWPVSKLTFEHCDAFVNAKDGGKVSNRVIRLSSLKQFFSLLTAKGYYVGNPASLVQIRHRDLSHEQKERVPKVGMTEREVKHILANTEGFWRWATALSYWAGYRLTDCACLEWASIMEKEIVVYTRKNAGSDVSRVAAPLGHEAFGGGALCQYLTEMMMAHSIHPQFVFPDERALILDPAKRSTLSVYYGRILTRLGIEGKSFHSLRHSFATRLDRAGWDLEKIGRAMGHGKHSTNVTNTYIDKRP